MEFDDYLREQDLSPRTVAGYMEDLAAFKEWFQARNGQALQPENLTPTDVRDYRAWLLKIGRKPAGINRHLASIRAYGSWGLAEKRIELNPAAAVHGIRMQGHAPKWLDKHQQAKLVREVEKDLAVARTEPAKFAARRNLAIIMTLMHTGLRVGELVGMRRDQVQINERSGNVRIIGKGMKVRSIPLNAHVRAALTDCFALQEFHPERPIFPLTRQAVHALLAEYGRRAEVPAAPHLLRHTFAKNLVDAGVPLDHVAMLLGHSKLETTRIYTIPGEQDLRVDVERLEL